MYRTMGSIARSRVVPLEMVQEELKGVTTRRALSVQVVDLELHLVEEEEAAAAQGHLMVVVEEEQN